MPLRDPRVVLREMLDAGRKARWVFDNHRREELDGFAGTTGTPWEGSQLVGTAGFEPATP